MENSILDFTAIIKNFSTVPLKGDELDEETGFYVDTIEARTGDPLESPVDDIFQDCTTENVNFIHLLLGHRGSGKSTEINKLEIKLTEAGFAVRKYDLQLVANFATLEVEDILILISNALLDICKEKNININLSDVEKLKYFFDPKEEVIIEKESAGISVNTGLGLSFSKIITLLSEVKGQIMGSSETITTVRRNLINFFDEWNVCIDNIIEKIKENDNQKYPIIIFENFDKIRPTERAIEIFGKGYLDNIRTPVIYTFPISLSYSEKFGAIEQYASSHFFPMIDVKTKAGKKNEKGYDTIKKIIAKRADLELFDEKTLNLIIEKTGGCLRDIFRIIVQTLRYTERQSKDKVGIKEVILALQNDKSSITRRITTKDYPALREIYATKNEIEDKNSMLRFLEAPVVLEYNGKRWHDLHPLIYDFLKENKRID
jgi:hypothetical protein